MLRNNQSRARLARLVFLCLALIAGATALLSLVAQGRPGWDAAAAGGATLATTTMYYGYIVLVIGQFGLVIGGYVVLIRWLRRAYYNLHQLPTIHPDYSDGWAAGAWFVPFLNFVRPFTIMREVWQDTQRAAMGRVVEPATVLNWWWAAFLLKMFIGRLTSRMGSKTGEDFTQADLLPFLIEAVVQLLAAALTWHVIGRCAFFEQQLAMRQQIDQLGQGIPPPTAQQQASQSDYALEEGY